MTRGEHGGSDISRAIDHVAGGLHDKFSGADGRAVLGFEVLLDPRSTRVHLVQGRVRGGDHRGCG